MGLETRIKSLSPEQVRTLLRSPEKRLQFALQHKHDVAAVWRVCFSHVHGQDKRTFRDVVYDVLSVYQTLNAPLPPETFVRHIREELERPENKDIETPRRCFTVRVMDEVRAYVHDNRLGHNDEIIPTLHVEFNANDRAHISHTNNNHQRITSVSIPDAVRTPEGVVNTVLRNFQAERFNGQEYTLDDLEREVERGLQKNKIDYDVPCPLTGFIAHTLYEHVRSKIPRTNRLFAREMNIVDVRQRLRLDLDRDSKEIILGHVPADYVRKHYFFESNTSRILYQDAHNVHSPSQIEGTNCWDSTGKEHVRIDLVNFATKHLPSPSATHVRYLGLEGPGFGSFLPLAHAFSITPLVGTFVEYDFRCYNLMRSLQRANLTRLLEHSETILGDVDERILLDFVKDEHIQLIKKDRSAEWQVRYDAPRRKTEYIPLESYHALLDELDNGIASREMAARYGISERFVHATTNRQKGTFDVVFLDYVGGLTSKRRQALEYLISRRLSERAVVAATLNVAHRITPLHRAGSASEMSSTFFDRITNAFATRGYIARDMINREYRESPTTDPMCFHAYYVERKA